jgi:hypothetical protein
MATPFKTSPFMRNSRHWVITGAVFIGMVGSMTVPALAAEPAKDAKPEAQTSTVPASVADTGELAENIYDAARDGKWDVVSGKLAELKSTAAKLKTDVATPGADQLGNLSKIESQIGAVEKAVVGKQKHEVMLTANQVTITAAEISMPFHPKVPADVTRLDYLGRELEIWSNADNSEKLKSTSEQLSATWKAVKPNINAHGGKAEAKAFGVLVNKVAGAKSTSDYSALVKPILDEVDKLEGVYK